MIQIDDALFDRATLAALSARWAETAGLGANDALRIAVCLPGAADWLALLFAVRGTRASVLPIHSATPYPAARRLAERAGCGRLLFGDAVETLGELSSFTSPQRGEVDRRSRAGEGVLTCPERGKPPHPALRADLSPLGRGEEERLASAEGELLQMSSGTTGEPKCVARRWSEIERELDAYVTAFREPDDMTPVIACPTTHSYGLICGVLAALKRGRTPVVVDPGNPRHLLKRLRETERPLLYSSPAVLHTLARLTPAGEQIHAVMTSGTLLPTPWFAEIRAKSRHMFQQYGCSEAGCVAINPDVTAADRIGRPLPHLRVEAGAGEGAPAEIVVHGPRGTIATSDLGYLAPDGGLVFVARLDDTINVSGLNVYPKEVEDVAMALPGVEDAVAFRIADAFAGERVGLLVSGPRPVPKAELMDGCRRDLAGHQTPVDIVQVAAIPRQANGKISRREVAALHASGALVAVETEAAR